MIVLDANVLIALLDPDDAHHDQARELLTVHAQEEYAASVLTVAEVLVHPTRAGLEDRARSALHDLGLLVLPIEGGEAAGLARTRARYGVRMPDAVVLHGALANGASLATFDEGLQKAAAQAGIRLSGAK